MKKSIIALLLTAILLSFSSCGLFEFEESSDEALYPPFSIPEYSYDEDWLTRPFIVSDDLLTPPPSSKALSHEYNGTPYVELNKGQPYFNTNSLLPNVFMRLSSLDAYGRAGSAVCCIGRETLCDDKRGDSKLPDPTGFHSVSYDVISSKYLYHRCHLLAYCLTGENSHSENIITGTAYFNTTGMLAFENMILDYIVSSGNHVMYRVTPIFKDDELVARGAIMEAFSVEDNGAGICFCNYVFNVQPDVEIDYSTGESKLIK